MVMIGELIETAEKDNVRVFDEKIGYNVAIKYYAIRHGEEAALQKLRALGPGKHYGSKLNQKIAESVSESMMTAENKQNDRGSIFEPMEDYDALIAAGKEHMANSRENRERTYSAPKSNIKEQHIRLGLGFLKLEQNQNKTMLNIFLRNSVWKNEHPKDIYNLHHQYFIKQRKLAACWALETLADLFGKSEKTIRRWRDELVAEGSMTVVKRYQKPDIYIMGEVDEEGNEKYYADKMDKIVH
jgi:hypothetical protein